MVKMTVSARRKPAEQGLAWLRRMTALLPMTLLVCIGCFGWLAIGDVYAAEYGFGTAATPLPPQPTAVPTANTQIVSEPAALVGEPLVWPWKQENPEPKARLGRIALNAVETTDDELASHAVSAANNVTSIGQLGGASFRVAVNGNFAYIGSGYNLTILNIANPAAVYVTGKTTSSWADEVLGISVQGGYAYVAAGNEGLRIVDVSNETQPVEVGFYNTPGYAWDVAVDGNLAYVADGENGLQIVDVAIAYAPQLKSNLALPGNAMDVAVAGAYTYVADENEGLRIVDISDPSYPIETGHLKTQGRAVGLAVAGDYVFLAADKYGLRIIDVESKSTPREIVAFDTRGNAYAVDLDAAANTAFVADAGEGLRAIDISNIGSPREIGHFDVAGCWANDIKVNGSYAYLIDTSHGLRVLNATNPAELSQVYLYNSPATTDVKVMNDIAFVPAGSAGLRVIDISTPASPSESGYFDTPGYAYAVDLAIPPGSSSTYACVADWEKGLRIVDVTNPRAPYEVGSVDTPGMARGVAVLWPYAYVADDMMGLQIVALNNISSPVIVGACDQATCMPAGGSARGVTMLTQSGSSQKLAFVADGNKGLQLIDVTDPLNPGTVGFYDTPGEAQNVAISPTYAYAYVADGFSGGLQIVDFSSLSNLKSLGAVDTEGGANDLYALRSLETNGDVLFLADGAQGVRVFAVEPLLGGRPTVTEKGFYDTRGWAGRLTVVGKTSYVADGEDGLRILEVSDSWVPYPITGMVTDGQGEPVAGVSIAVNPGSTTQTDSEGKFTIKDVLAGKVVTVTPSLTGYTFSPTSTKLTIQNIKKNCNFSATRILKEGVNGHILDNDGKPLAGVTIQFVSGQEGIESKAIQSITTNNQGIYALQGLKAGKYIVTPSMEGYTFSPASLSFSIPLQIGEETDGIFVGQKDKQPSIKGIVLDDKGISVPGVTITGDCGVTAISDESGSFQFNSGETEKPCTLTPLKEGYAFSPMKFVVRFSDVGAMQEAVPQQITAYANRLSGKVSDRAGSAVIDVEVSLSSGSKTITDQEGMYQFSGIPAGAYTMQLKKEGYSFTPAAAEIVIPKDQRLDFTAYAAIFPFGGMVRDETGIPVAGVIVSDNAGHQVTTDENGVYFMALPGGAYTLTAAKNGLAFDPPTRQIKVGQEAQSQDFTAKQVEYSFTGIIRFQGQPIAGVKISDGSAKFVTSDANGVFRWSGPAGNYVLTPVKEGFSFVPEVLHITLPVLLDAVIEFEAKEGVFTANGIVLTQDGSALAGVSLADQIGQSMSNPVGEFTFERERGTYTFRAAKDGYKMAPDAFDVTFPVVDGGGKLELLATPLCPNYILNGDFERDGDWSPQSGAVMAFSQEVVFRSLRAAVVGPTQGTKPLSGHINLKQKVTIPKNAKSADLRFMLYLFSENELDASGDAQQVLILDKNEKQKERVLNLHTDDRTWIPYRIGLRKYAGQTIWISFDVSNNGKGGSLGMVIDDVTLQVCE